MRTAYTPAWVISRSSASCYVLNKSVCPLMSIDYPEVTEQDAPHVVDRKERLAKFVLELWAQRHNVAQARRKIDKKLADDTQLLN